MCVFLEIVFYSSLLWIYLQALCVVLISLVYHFSVPWIVWGTLTILAGIRLVRIPRPDPGNVKEVLGSNPFFLGKEDSGLNDQGNGEEYCMRVVAHRGGGYDFPENSISAFRNSKEKGCTAVEFDISLTKDNIPIIFHDKTVERLTGQSGIIAEMNWKDLKDLDISSNHPLKNKFVGGERIALLEDVVKECLKNGQRMMLDVKATGKEIVEIITETFKKHPELYRKALVASFNPVTVYMIRRKDPKIVCALTWRPYFFSRESYLGTDGLGPVRYNNIFKHILAATADCLYEWALPRLAYYIVGISAVLLHKDIIHLEIVRRWHEKDIRVIAWTVNLPSEKAHFSRQLKVTYLTDTLLGEKIS